MKKIEKSSVVACDIGHGLRLEEEEELNSRWVVEAGSSEELTLD